MKALWRIFPLVLTAIILCFKEWETLQHINTVLFGNYHDALKNYYTVLYHVKWDSSYFHFEGMNYPFGEHVLFTDNQPFLSNTLKFFQRNLFDVMPYMLGILNGMLFLSFLLTAWFNNLTLRHLGVQHWLAAFVSVGLVFLSPQLNRINGHFGLSYSFIIPLFFYLGLLHLSKPNWWRSILIGAATLAVGLLHAYNLGFALLITGTLFLINVVYRSWSILSSAVHFSLQAILPFLAMQVLMLLTDPVSDRPSYPWSPFIGDFQPEGFLVSYDNPIGLWLHFKLQMNAINWEAEAYLGMATLLILATVALLTISVFKKGLMNNGILLVLKDPKKTFLLLGGIAAILISYIFSKLSAHTEIYQIMGPLRQFRAVGRFHWVGFFAANFLAFAWFSLILKHLKPILRWVFSIALIGLLAFDAYHSSKNPYHTEHETPLLTESSPEQKQMHQLLQDFNAIIPLPYFHIGSEDFLLEAANSQHYKNAMGVSHAAGLPLTAINLSRTSLSQTLEQLTYSIWPLEFPPFAEHLKNQKTVLLIQKESALTLNEQLLINAGGRDTVYENHEYYLQAFELQPYIQQHASQDSIHDYFQYSPENTYLRKDYESNQEQRFVGAGCKKVTLAELEPIESFQVPSSANKATIGLWVYLNQPTKAFDNFSTMVLSNNNVSYNSQPLRIANHLKAIDNNWGYFETDVDLPIDAQSIELIFQPNTLHPTHTYVDMLRVSYTNSQGIFLKTPKPTIK